MRIANIIITSSIGIGLLTGTLLTAHSGLSEDDKSCYESAVSMQKQVDMIGFPGFLLTDYPVTFCDGKYDYVLVQNGAGYDVSKRSPVIETIAATAYEVDGHYEVIAPTKALMGNLFTFSGGGYDEKTQVSVIWHEAFHCWQMTNFGDNISALIGTHSFEDENYGESLIVEVCDKNEEAVNLFTQQLLLLDDAVSTEDIDKIYEDITQYKKLETQRNDLLDEAVQGLENYYAITEGSACYVESLICRMQDEQRFQTQYLDSISVYQNGAGKYYVLGMVQCMLLDRLDEGWKSDYDFSIPLTELIYEKLGV